MNYTKINLNPTGKKGIPDCAVRAVMKATDQSWNKVYRDLCDLGFEMKTMPNAKSCVEAYILKQGFVKNKMPRHADNTKYTVRELITKLPNTVMIIQVANHFTVSVAGHLYDTWDCSEKSVYNFYSK